MQVIEAQSFWSWRLTITCISTRVGCQPTVQAAHRSPPSAAVDEIQQEVGLPPVTAGRRAFALTFCLTLAVMLPIGVTRS